MHGWELLVHRQKNMKSLNRLTNHSRVSFTSQLLPATQNVVGDEVAVAGADVQVSSHNLDV